MAVAAKSDRKYLGLVQMDMPQPFTPYHAYAMVRSAFEAELLDPRDFRSKGPGYVPTKTGQTTIFLIKMVFFHFLLRMRSTIVYLYLTLPYQRGFDIKVCRAGEGGF